jgi:hypothetical protein
MPLLELSVNTESFPPLTRGQKLSPPTALLLSKSVGRWPVRVLVETATGIDVGLWFRWRRIWLCATDHRLIMVADGPRPYVQSVTYDRLQTSFYCHLSGELVLVPAPELGVRSLLIGPIDGWKILRLIFNENAGPEAEYQAPVPLAPARVAETIAQQIAEPIAEDISEPIADSIAEPMDETVDEPAAKSVVEKAASKLAEPVMEVVAEPIGEPIAEPIADPIAEPIAEPIGEKADTIAEPIAEPIDDEADAKQNK